MIGLGMGVMFLGYWVLSYGIYTVTGWQQVGIMDLVVPGHFHGTPSSPSTAAAQSVSSTTPSPAAVVTSTASGEANTIAGVGLAAAGVNVTGGAVSSFDQFLKSIGL